VAIRLRGALGAASRWREVLGEVPRPPNNTDEVLGRSGTLGETPRTLGKTPRTLGGAIQRRGALGVAPRWHEVPGEVPPLPDTTDEAPQPGGLGGHVGDGRRGPAGAASGYRARLRRRRDAGPAPRQREMAIQDQSEMDSR